MAAPATERTKDPLLKGVRSKKKTQKRKFSENDFPEREKGKVSDQKLRREQVT